MLEPTIRLQQKFHDRPILGNFSVPLVGGNRTVGITGAFDAIHKFLQVQECVLPFLPRDGLLRKGSRRPNQIAAPSQRKQGTLEMDFDAAPGGLLFQLCLEGWRNHHGRNLSLPIVPIGFVHLFEKRRQGSASSYQCAVVVALKKFRLTNRIKNVHNNNNKKRKVRCLSSFCRKTIESKNTTTIAKSLRFRQPPEDLPEEVPMTAP